MSNTNRKYSGRTLFNNTSVFIKFVNFIMRLVPETFCKFLWDLFNNFDGIFFRGIRYLLLVRLIKSCGVNVSVSSNVRIIGFKGLSIGNNVSIHDFCYIHARGGITIYDNVSIAHGTSVLSTNHTYADEKIPIKYNNVQFDRTVIGNDVWIGCGCRIMAGVMINERTVVAAGALLNKSFEGNSLLGGIPAKIIKEI